MIATCSLGSVVAVSTGQPAPKADEFSDRGIPFIRAGSLENLLDGGTLADCERVSETTARKNRLRLYPKDTVVFAKSGMSATLGRIYRLPEPAYVVSHLATLVPTGGYDPRYLTYWLRRNPPSHLIKDPAYPSIRTSEIEQVQVPRISLPEQGRIATILDKADDVRRGRERALTLANNLLRSTFLAMFGDLELNPLGWETRSLGELLATDPQNGLYRPAQDYGSGVGILRIDGFYDGYLVKNKPLKRLQIDGATIGKYRLSEDDIVINRVNSREYLGKSALIEQLQEQTVFESNMMRFRIDNHRMNSRFLVDQLQTAFVKRQILRASKDAVNQSSINQTDVKNLVIRVPPMNLQRRYASVVAWKNRADERLREALDGAEDLFGSLSQRAFSGEL